MSWVRFQSGSTAPHMLGNQLNPSSSMAQKMSDALNDELEAHSIFTTADSNSTANNFVGPPLYNKIISSVSVPLLRLKIIRIRVN